MTRTRFEELRQGIVDGSLAEQWAGRDDASLTKAQRVEKRQILALVNLFLDDPQKLTFLCQREWRELFIKRRDDGSAFIEVKLLQGARGE